MSTTTTAAPVLDFVMLDALRETHAADAAIRQAIAFLSGALTPSN